MAVAALLLVSALVWSVGRAGDGGPVCDDLAIAAVHSSSAQLVRCNSTRATRLSAATLVDAGRWAVPHTRGRGLFIVQDGQVWPVRGMLRSGPVAVAVTDAAMASPHLAERDPAAGETVSVVGSPAVLNTQGAVEAMGGWRIPDSSAGQPVLDANGLIAGMVYDVSSDGQTGEVVLLDRLRKIARSGGSVGAHIIERSR